MENTFNNKFIPYRKDDLIKLCADDGVLNEADQTAFLSLCRLLESVFHFEFHEKTKALKAAFAPFNTDLDTQTLHVYSDTEKSELQSQLVETMTGILQDANYRKITKQDLKDALSEKSLFNIRLEVDFNDFEDIIFYMRGENKKQATLKKFFGLKEEQVEYTNYERVAIYIKFKDQAYFDRKKKKDDGITPGATIIKLFKDVPKADLELLFPNGEIRMRNRDKLMIGLPAAAGGITVLVTKLGASLLLIASVISFWLGFREEEVVIKQEHLITLGIGLGSLGAFLFKQFTKFQNRKIKFMKTMAESLYFKNLDNNEGVFHHLVDSAEQEECKEAILAYYFLLREGKAMTADALDKSIEAWFKQNHQCNLNFEVKDALEKLTRLELAALNKGEYTALELNAAKKSLDLRWDNYFNFA